METEDIDFMRTTVLHAEDIQECASWGFPDMAKAANRKKTVQPEDFKREERERAAHLKKLEKQAHEKGFAEGKEEGYNVGLANLEDEIKRFDTLLQSFEASVKGLNHIFEKQVMDLAIAIAKAITRHEILTNPEVIMNVVQEALSYLPNNAKGIKVHMNHFDVEVIKKAASENVLTALDNVNIIANEEIQPGGCVVESESSHVDASLEQRMKEVLQQIETAD